MVKFVSWIHCLYDTKTVGDLQDLIRSVRRIVPKAVINIVVVNNSLEDVVLKDPEIRFLSGSNRLQEFSAWEEGWDFIKKNGCKSDVVIISNDTINKHHYFNKYLFYHYVASVRLNANSDRWSKVPVAIGITENITCLPGVNSYLSSFCFVLNPVAADLVMENICVTCSPADVNLEFKFGDGLVTGENNKYNSFVNDWLIGSGKLKWYQSRKHTAESHRFLSRKAQCIILEHSIAIRIRCGSGIIVSCFDYCFLLSVFLRWVNRLLDKHKKYINYGWH